MSVEQDVVYTKQEEQDKENHVPLANEAILRKKRELVQSFLSKGMLITEDLLDTLAKPNPNDLSGSSQKLSLPQQSDPAQMPALSQPSCVPRGDTSSSLAILSKENENEYEEQSPNFLSHVPPPPGYEEGTVKVVLTYDEHEKKRELQDFVDFFNSRYAALRRILENRQELQNAVSISRILGKHEKNAVAIIGIICEKNITANNNYVLTLEDPTGQVKVLVNKSKPELFKLAQELVLDEVIGIVGTSMDTIVFANNILHPDVPLNKELKKAPDEVYALFLSDIHVGSRYFLPNEFNRFLSWIRRETGTEEQKDIAQKVKYIFFVGDLVDGVGVYPDQQKELIIPDIYDQYTSFAALISKIPSYIKLIMCAGNHDALRLAEPQPKHDLLFSKPLYQLPNVTIVSNPSLVNIHAKEGFPGIDVLMYHGYSFDYYVANVDHIREQGGYDRADLIMKFLLQRRHLAPTHTSTLYVPNPTKDPLIIDKVPDIFASGHIHRAVAANYRNVTLISGSCWQSTTAFQVKMGHHPEPARVPAVNLKTRKVKMLRF